MVVLTSGKFEKAIIHPTVLLGVVDHMNRIVNNDDERVVGALLGTVRKGVIDITSSFGVPFKERPSEGIWVLDVDYVSEMIKMTRKVSVNEVFVGWYQTGSQLHNNDISINERFRTLNPDVIAVLVDPKPKDMGFPTKAYIAVEETHDDGNPTTKTFQHFKIEIGAEEAEEVGVEHLLRDIGSEDVHSLTQSTHNNIMALKGLETYLCEISKYLNDVSTNVLPTNTEILERIQSILYELPLITDKNVRDALTIQNNDDSCVVLLSVLTKCVITLNSLVNNKAKIRPSSGDQRTAATKVTTAKK